MAQVTFIETIYTKKVGSKKFRVAAYFNGNFNCNMYCVEQYKAKLGFCPVGNLSSFDKQYAIDMLDSRF